MRRGALAENEHEVSQPDCHFGKTIGVDFYADQHRSGCATRETAGCLSSSETRMTAPLAQIERLREWSAVEVALTEADG